MIQPTPKSVLILGGTSDIGRAIAAAYGANGWHIILVVRNRAAGDRDAADLAVRFATRVDVEVLDVVQSSDHGVIFDRLAVLPDTVVCAVGMLGDQLRAQTDPAHAVEIIRTNFEGPVMVLEAVADRMARRGSGVIVGVSSVAGDRGRAANYIYGASKAGLTAFLSGLRGRLAPQGVHVLTVKPGFVRTRMTEGMSLPGLLTASPKEVGDAVYRASEVSRRDTIYVRPIWRLIMTIVVAIPERLFMRLKL